MMNDEAQRNDEIEIRMFSPDHETIAKAARLRLMIAPRNLTALSRQVYCHHSTVSVDEITFACVAGIWSFAIRHSAFVI